MKRNSKSNEDESRSQLRSMIQSLMIQGGIPDELATKMLVPLTPDEKAEIERFEDATYLREWVENHRSDLLKSLEKMRYIEAYRQELFCKLVAQGVPVRKAIELTDLKIAEDDIKTLEGSYESK